MTIRQLQRLADRMVRWCGLPPVTVRAMRAGSKAAGWCYMRPGSATVTINLRTRYHRTTLAHELAHVFLWDTKHDAKHACVTRWIWEMM